jgi:hypothetical protein
VLLVFHLTCLAWVFFRAQSFAGAWRILSSIAAMGDMSLAAVDNKILVIKGAMLIAGLLLVEVVTLPKREASREVSPVRRLAFAAACIWVLLLFGSFSGNTFIYFQF